MARGREVAELWSRVQGVGWGETEGGEGTCPEKQGSLLGLYFQIGRGFFFGGGADFRAVSPHHKGMWKSGKSSKMFKGTMFEESGWWGRGWFWFAFCLLG